MKQTWSVFFIALIFLGYKIWSYPLIDADEPRYAEAAKEMINAQQYLIPLADGAFRFEKPILFYWFEILSFKVFGINEWAARLPSVIAGATTLGFVSWLGSFYRIGFLAPIVLMTSLEFFVISRMSITDASLNLFIVAVMILFYLIYEKHIQENYIYLLAVMAALGFLTKGPIAILLPTMVGTLYILITRNQGDIFSLLRRYSVKALLIFFSIAAPWYLAIHLATAGDFTQYFFIGQNIGRFSSTLSGHHQPWWFYIAVLVIGSMPWSLYLPAMIADFKFNTEKLRLKIFALIWIVTVIGFFSFSSTKLANYVMSIFVPVAILFALWLESKPSRKWLIINSSFYLVILFGLALVYRQGYLDKLIASEAFVANNLVKFIVIGFIVFGIFLSIIITELFPGLFFKSQTSVFKSFFVVTAIAICIVTVDYGLIPFAHYKEAGIKNFVAQVPADAQLYLLTIDRPSVSFYSRSNTFPKNLRLKRINKQLAAGEKLCVIAKHDKAEQINEIPELKLWFKDDIYLFACNFINPSISSKL